VPSKFEPFYSWFNRLGFFSCENFRATAHPIHWALAQALVRQMPERPCSDEPLPKGNSNEKNKGWTV
jgi:hypothetical protein